MVSPIMVVSLSAMADGTGRRRCRSAARLDLRRTPPLVENARLQRGLPHAMDALTAPPRRPPLRSAVRSSPLGYSDASAHRRAPAAFRPPARSRVRRVSLARVSE